MNNNIALVGAAVCSSLAVGYFLGKLHGSRRYADDYIQRPGREFKKTEGLKTFLEYVAEHSSPEHQSVTELRRVSKYSNTSWLPGGAGGCFQEKKTTFDSHLPLILLFAISLTAVNYAHFCVGSTGGPGVFHATTLFGGGGGGDHWGVSKTVKPQDFSLKYRKPHWYSRKIPTAAQNARKTAYIGAGIFCRLQVNC